MRQKQREKEAETETERRTDKQTETDRGTQWQRQGDKEAERDRNRNRNRDTKRERERNRQRQRHRETERERERVIDLRKLGSISNEARFTVCWLSASSSGYTLHGCEDVAVSRACRVATARREFYKNPRCRYSSLVLTRCLFTAPSVPAARWKLQVRVHSVPAARWKLQVSQSLLFLLPGGNYR